MRQLCGREECCLPQAPRRPGTQGVHLGRPRGHPLPGTYPDSRPRKASGVSINCAPDFPLKLHSHTVLKVDYSGCERRRKAKSCTLIPGNMDGCSLPTSWFAQDSGVDDKRATHET